MTPATVPEFRSAIWRSGVIVVKVRPSASILQVASVLWNPLAKMAEGSAPPVMSPASESSTLVLVTYIA